MTTTEQDKREARVLHAVTIAREVAKLHSKFTNAVCDGPEDEQDGALEPAAHEQFHKLIETLWEVARSRSGIADDHLDDLLPPAPKVPTKSGA